ncbi:MAG: hypothetical protein JNK05_33555 [Myxococcales bacterium]|nr:hypothetical protein [Myxococcales bacterium]
MVAPDSFAQSAGASASVTVGARADVSAGVAVAAPSRADIGAALSRIPLRIGVHGGLGWTRSWDRPLLDGYATEIGGSLGVWATPWLAIEGRGTYTGLLRRVVDADANGRADANPGYLESLLVTGQLRFRLSEDEEKRRNGWSFSIGGGALIPWANADGRGAGPIAEAAIARHVGVLSQSGSALDLSFELRARTGFGSLIDYQSIVGGVAAAWEGNQRVGARVGPRVGYRPGHTAGIEGTVGGYFSNPALAGTNILWSNAGGGFGVHMGLVLSPGFELMARGGYQGRGAGRRDDDWLHFGFVEGGLRARWYLFFAEVDAGLFAPFGAFRDRVATSPFAGGAIGLRLPFNGPENEGFRFVTGLRTRVGLTSERSFDGLFFTAGIEFEGGQHHAAFPRFSPPSVEVVPVGVGAAGSVGVAGSARVSVGSSARTGTVGAQGTAVTTSGSRGSVAYGSQGGSVMVPAEPARVPLAINLGFHAGYIGPMQGARLQRTVGELSLTASYTPTHWFALDARAAWFGAFARTEDTNRDGRTDTTFDGFGGPHLSLGGRFRWLDDTESLRYGWTFALAGGAMLPTTGPLVARGPGATIDLAIAREFGWMLDAHNAFGFAVELRGRTGLGAWGDYQTAMIGVRAWWEGNIPKGRTRIQETTAYRPGHTVAFDGGLAIFPFGAVRGNGARYFGDIGAHLGATAGIVFTPGFEWSLRGGYLHRAGSSNIDDLQAITLETGPRMRIGWIEARAIAGYAAVFGAHRDEVQSAFYAGAGVHARLAVTERVRFLAGIEGRFALANERALDHISLQLGFEFEGGSHFAAPFPRREVTYEPPPAVDVVTYPTTRPVTPVRASGTTSVGVSGGAGVGVGVGVAAGASVSTGVTVPLRVSLGMGMHAASRGLGRFELDGSGGMYQLSVGWVPSRWFVLEATGSLLTARGRNADLNGDGGNDVVRDGMLLGAVSVGPRFRVLTDDFARFGWSFLLAGGVMASPVGVGPMGEAAIAHHLAAITDSHMAFEFGIEARGRLGWQPNMDAGSRGDLYQSLSVGLTAAWEGNVRRNSAPMTAAQLGNTLSLEGGYGFALSGSVGPRANLGGSQGYVGVRTGLVFTRGFEWHVRAGYAGRAGERNTESHETLLAESGPRFRWGWAYGELNVGYAGTINAYRESVAGSITGSVGAGVRFGLTGEGRHFGITGGLQARFGIGPERAYDAVFAMVGLEFEGGRRQAAPFPAVSPAPSPRGPMPSPTVEVPVTSPRYQATGGRVQTPTVVIPSRIEVGVSGSAVIGGATTVGGTVLIPGAVVDSTPFGNGYVTSADEIAAMLPAVDGSVRGLEINLRTGPSASALSAESALREAVSRRYGAAPVSVRVSTGASVSGRFELELRAR